MYRDAAEVVRQAGIRQGVPGSRARNRREGFPVRADMLNGDFPLAGRTASLGDSKFAHEHLGIQASV
jgi:hypothetical protein